MVHETYLVKNQLELKTPTNQIKKQRTQQNANTHTKQQ